MKNKIREENRRQSEKEHTSGEEWWSSDGERRRHRVGAAKCEDWGKIKFFNLGKEGNWGRGNKISI